MHCSKHVVSNCIETEHYGKILRTEYYHCCKVVKKTVISRLGTKEPCFERIPRFAEREEVDLSVMGKKIKCEAWIY